MHNIDNLAALLEAVWLAHLCWESHSNLNIRYSFCYNVATLKNSFDRICILICIFLDSGSSRSVTIRQCGTVPRHTLPGPCTHEISGSSITIEFCEYCEYDGCNGAGSLQKSLFAFLVPAVLLWVFFRKWGARDLLDYRVSSYNNRCTEYKHRQDGSFSM